MQPGSFDYGRPTRRGWPIHYLRLQIFLITCMKRYTYFYKYIFPDFFQIFNSHRSPSLHVLPPGSRSLVFHWNFIHHALDSMNTSCLVISTKFGSIPSFDNISFTFIRGACGTFDIGFAAQLQVRREHMFRYLHQLDRPYKGRRFLRWINLRPIRQTSEVSGKWDLGLQVSGFSCFCQFL